MLQTIFEQTVLCPDSLSLAFVGTCMATNRGIYSKEKCVNLIVSNMQVVGEQDVSREVAAEFFDRNIVGAFLGPNAPIFMA